MVLLVRYQISFSPGHNESVKTFLTELFKISFLWQCDSGAVCGYLSRLETVLGANIKHTHAN